MCKGYMASEVYFSENVVVEEIPVEVNSLKSFEDIMKLIQQGTNEIKVHEVQEGESFWTIAKKYDIDVEDLEKANLGLQEQKSEILPRLRTVWHCHSSQES